MSRRLSLKLMVAHPSTQVAVTNDTATVGPITFALGGTFVVGPSGAADYPDLATAFTDLETNGVCAPVTLEIESGTYEVNEEFFGPITGNDATNTITITSQTGNATDVILERPAAATDNYVIEVGDITHLTIENLTFRDSNFGDTQARLLVTNGGGDLPNLTIRNNRFIGDVNATGTSDDQALLYMSTGDDKDDMTIESNFFEGGSFGAWIGGSNNNDNLLFSENTFRNNTYTGLYMEDGDFVQIFGNDIRCTTSTETQYYGIELNFCYGADVQDNLISTNNRAVGIYYYFASDGTRIGRMVNNAVTVGQANSTLASYAIQIDNSDLFEFHHNSGLLTGSTNAGGSALRVENGVDDLDNQNNSFVTEGTAGVAAAFEDALTSATLDYNNYFSTTGQLVNWNGTDYANLAAYQAAAAPFDANAISVNPNFVSNDSLVPTNPAVQVANPIGTVTTDLLGDTRDASNSLGRCV